MKSYSTDKENRRFVREDWWADLVLFLATFFLIFWVFGDRSLWAAEERLDETSREMFLTKDFLHSTIGGESYFDKPLLTYWLIAIISITIGAFNEWVIRLPSAVAGVLVIWATKNIGTRLWSAKTGRIAAWILLTTYGFLLWSRAGIAETENLAAIILAIAWYWSRRDQLNFVTFQIFYLIAFIGALTKGLTAVIVPVLAILPDILQNKRWKALLKPFHFAALALAIVIYLTPFLYFSLIRTESYQSSGLEPAFRENIIRYVKPFDKNDPIYIYYVPLLLLPWAPLWTAAIASAVRIWKSLDDRTKWIVKAAILIFIFFTLSDSRRGYYILPMLPFYALLIAIFVVRIRNRRINAFRRWGLQIQRALFIVLALFELIASLTFLILRSKISLPFPSKLYVVSIIIGISALLIVIITNKFLRYLKLESNTNSMIISSIAMATVLLGGYFCWQENILNVYQNESGFDLNVKARTVNLPPENIGFSREKDTIFLFCMEEEINYEILSLPVVKNGLHGYLRE